MSKYRLDGIGFKGDWEERADPQDAFDQMVAQGYDPDNKYCVAKPSGDLITVVYHGNLMECLVEASNRSADGYYVVLLTSDLQHAEKVEVH